MSLTPIRSFESARRKFFMNSTSCLESRNETFLGSGGRNESNRNQLARPARIKFLMNSTYIMSKK